MTTIKAYTDLEQSEKLSEILPIDSADMCYDGYALDNDGNHPVRLHKPDGEYDIPCWSLTALLNVLPDHFYDRTGRKTLGISKGDTYYNVFYENKNSYIQKSTGNPVDACYGMIIYLHELKML